jgi:hypothetical protein
VSLLSLGDGRESESSARRQGVVKASSALASSALAGNVSNAHSHSLTLSHLPTHPPVYSAPVVRERSAQLVVTRSVIF